MNWIELRTMPSTLTESFDTFDIVVTPPSTPYNPTGDESAGDLQFVLDNWFLAHTVARVGLGCPGGLTEGEGHNTLPDQ